MKAKNNQQDGAARIAAERRRQIKTLRWGPQHDDREHSDGELATAAACYASPGLIYMQHQRGNEIAFDDPWPWDPNEDDRTYDDDASRVLPNSQASLDERIRLLEKAGALCAAEIDRLLRQKKHEQKRQQRLRPRRSRSAL